MVVLGVLALAGLAAAVALPRTRAPEQTAEAAPLDPAAQRA
jgi:hypothetical protein